MAPPSIYRPPSNSIASRPGSSGALPGASLLTSNLNGSPTAGSGLTGVIQQYRDQAQQQYRRSADRPMQIAPAAASALQQGPSPFVPGKYADAFGAMGYGPEAQQPQQAGPQSLVQDLTQTQSPYSRLPTDSTQPQSPPVNLQGNTPANAEANATLDQIIGRRRPGFQYHENLGEMRTQPPAPIAEEPQQPSFDKRVSLEDLINSMAPPTSPQPTLSTDQQQQYDAEGRVIDRMKQIQEKAAQLKADYVPPPQADWAARNKESQLRQQQNAESGQLNSVQNGRTAGQQMNAGMTNAEMQARANQGMEHDPTGLRGRFGGVGAMPEPAAPVDHQSILSGLYNQGQMPNTTGAENQFPPTAVDGDRGINTRTINTPEGPLTVQQDRSGKYALTAHKTPEEYRANIERRREEGIDPRTIRRAIKKSLETGRMYGAAEDALVRAGIPLQDENLNMNREGLLAFLNGEGQGGMNSGEIKRHADGRPEDPVVVDNAQKYLTDVKNADTFPPDHPVRKKAQALAAVGVTADSSPDDTWAALQKASKLPDKESRIQAGRLIGEMVNAQMDSLPPGDTEKWIDSGGSLFGQEKKAFMERARKVNFDDEDEVDAWLSLLDQKPTPTQDFETQDSPPSTIGDFSSGVF